MWDLFGDNPHDELAMLELKTATNTNTSNSAEVLANQKHGKCVRISGEDKTGLNGACL